MRRDGLLMILGSLRVFVRTGWAFLLLYGAVTGIVLLILSILSAASGVTGPLDLLRIDPAAFLRERRALTDLLAWVVLLALIAPVLAVVPFTGLLDFAMAAHRGESPRLLASIRRGIEAVPALIAPVALVAFLGLALVASFLLLLGARSTRDEPLEPVLTLAFLGSLAALLVTFTALALVPPIVLEERVSLMRAIRSGWARGRGWRYRFLAGFASLGLAGLAFWLLLRALLLGGAVPGSSPVSEIAATSLGVAVLGGWLTIFSGVAYNFVVHPEAVRFAHRRPGSAQHATALERDSRVLEDSYRSLVAEGLRHRGLSSVGSRAGFPVAAFRKGTSGRFRTTLVVRVETSAVAGLEGAEPGLDAQAQMAGLPGRLDVNRWTRSLTYTEIAHVPLTPQDLASRLEAVVTFASRAGPPPEPRCEYCGRPDTVNVASVDDVPSFVCAEDFIRLEVPPRATRQDLVRACLAGVLGVALGSWVFGLANFLFGIVARPGAFLVVVFVGWLVQTSVRRVSRRITWIAVTAGVISVFLGDILVVLLLAGYIGIGVGVPDAILAYLLLIALAAPAYAISFGALIVGVAFVSRRMRALAEDESLRAPVVW
ncbi:MAG TPA: hypothetical protein VI999_06525 [Thermoplasmata archaeon]|nr:hypothetical protein [Thermoplasmata archaeon]